MAEKFEAWGIVELMGHQRTAGRLTEETIAGANLLRVDFPDKADLEKFRTVYYGPSAIYALHVTGESAARLAASGMGTRPAYAWELDNAISRQLRAPEPPTDEEEGFEHEVHNEREVEEDDISF
jgi:hypothetical protein